MYNETTGLVYSPVRENKYMNGLEENIQLLGKWLKTQSNAAEWNSVLIGDESNLYDEGKLHINKEKLNTLNEYKPTFESLMNKGFSWLNLSAVGVLNGVLIVCVEKPRKSGTVPLGKTSVNFSGSAVELII